MAEHERWKGNAHSAVEDPIMENGEREEYHLDDVAYLKVYDPALKKHFFYRNGQQINIREWNRTLNRHQPMENKLLHPFFLVRYLERRRRRILLDLVHVEDTHLGADVGCERGYLAVALASRGARLVAVDLDPDVVLEAKKSTTFSPAVNFVCSDVAALALKSGFLDFCLCAETLEHVEQIEEALKELARVVRPGGKLILAIPNERWIIILKKVLHSLGLGRVLGRLSRGQAMGHVRSFKRREILRLLPKNTRVVRAFYDKPFFLNLFIVAEVTW